MKLCSLIVFIDMPPSISVVLNLQDAITNCIITVYYTFWFLMVCDVLEENQTK